MGPWRLDARAISVFRVGLGVTSLVDLGSRAVDLGAHYSDGGLLPRAMLPSSLFPHFWSGSSAWQGVLFALAALASLALIAGWKSRWMAGLLTLLLWSLHARNPQVLFAGDVLFRWLFLLALTLPLGGAWSAEKSPRKDVRGLRALLPLALLAAVYGVGALLKSGAWYSGEALAMALRIQHYAGPMAPWLLAHPKLCEALTWLTLVAELATPLLLFLPRWRLRLGLAAFWILAHGAFSLGLRVGIFPWVAWSAWLLLLPAQVFGAPASLGYSRGGDRLAGGLLCVLLATNLHSLGWAPLPTVEATLDRLRLSQHWNMYAPEPMDREGWLLLQGQFEGRPDTELFSGQLWSLDKPQDLSSHYGGMRWRKAIRAQMIDPTNRYREPMVIWACRHWTRVLAEDPPTRINMVWVYEDSGPPERVTQVLPVGGMDCPPGPTTRSGSRHH